MPIRNIYLREAVESTVKPDEVASEMKKLLQVCRLTKYTSVEKCSEFYNQFFCQSLPGKADLTAEDWGIVYVKLLSDPVFKENFQIYMAAFKPSGYGSMFKPYMTILLDELKEKRDHRASHLGNGVGTLEYINSQMEAMKAVVVPQTHGDTTSADFFTTVQQVLFSNIVKLQDMIREELGKEAIKDGYTPMMSTEDISNEPLAEDAREFLAILENSDQWINSYMNCLNEGIVSKAAMKAKEMNLAKEKAERAFDEFVMKKFREMQNKRRNAKHSEMVGESIRLMREIKRLLRSGIISIFSPTVGVITWIVTLFIDKQTDANDRKVLIGELKDELEIIEEKIAMAERNGDDKAKIELIRVRQKYYKEYERINRIAFDKQRLNREVHM